MNYNKFIYPLKAKIVPDPKEKEKVAQVIIDPCYPGYGVTLGNTLRRVLLSSVEGGAAIGMKIKGVEHEFTSIKGVFENVIDIMLNVKELRFKMYTDKPVELELKVKGKKIVTGDDIINNSDVDVINKEQKICELTDKSSEMEMTIVVGKGIGFSPVEKREINKNTKKEIGYIELDANFSPVTKVSFEVKNTRVEKRIDYDKVLLNIKTDGSITPMKAFNSACASLSKSYAILAGIKEEEIQKEVEEIKADAQEEEEKKIRENVIDQNLMKANLELEEDKIEEKKRKAEVESQEKTLKELGISEKIVNLLNKANVKTVGEVMKKTENDLLIIEGIGAASVKEIKKAIGKLGIILSK